MVHPGTEKCKRISSAMQRSTAVEDAAAQLHAQLFFSVISAMHEKIVHEIAKNNNKADGADSKKSGKDVVLVNFVKISLADELIS